MICTHCSTENPDLYKFCGNCGKPLERVPEPALVGSARTSRSGISGPSFLGLADESSDPEVYLLEDNPPSRGHGGWIAFTMLSLALLAGMGWFAWKALQKSALPPPIASAPPPPSVSVTPPDSPNATAASGADAQPSQAGATTQKPWGAESLPQADQTAEDKKADEKAVVEATSRQARDSHENKEATVEEDEDTAPDTPTADKSAAKETSPGIPETKSKSKAKEIADQQNRMLQLGEKYLYGRGVSPNCSQAVVYFKAAAAENNAAAMLHLGAIYASGQCVKQDRATAYSWFQRAQAADPNNPWISRNMNMVLRDMTPQERASISRQ